MFFKLHIWFIFSIHLLILLDSTNVYWRINYGYILVSVCLLTPFMISLYSSNVHFKTDTSVKVRKSLEDMEEKLLAQKIQSKDLEVSLSERALYQCEWGHGFSPQYQQTKEASKDIFQSVALLEQMSAIQLNWIWYGTVSLPWLYNKLQPNLEIYLGHTGCVYHKLLSDQISSK